jgi:hypothetical protein
MPTQDDALPARPDRVEDALARIKALQTALMASSGLPAPRDGQAEHLLARMEQLVDHMVSLAPDYEHLGRDVLSTLQARFPELWPLVDRELLWFFGGDCLHFLTDEEIRAYQERDDD